MEHGYIYRVVFAVRYSDAWFDFDSIDEAGEFAKQVLTHLTPNEDTKRNNVHIEVIDPNATNNDEEDE